MTWRGISAGPYGVDGPDIPGAPRAAGTGKAVVAMAHAIKEFSTEKDKEGPGDIARRVIGSRLTQDTRVQITLDDVSINFCQAPEQGGGGRHWGAHQRGFVAINLPRARGRHRGGVAGCRLDLARHVNRAAPRLLSHVIEGGGESHEICDLCELRESHD